MTDELAGRALDQLLEVTSLLGADMSRALAAQGLTEAKAHVLFLLGAEGPCTQRDLAGPLGVSPRTVTTLVDDLGRAGLVTREPHPSDRRAVLVTPTSAGSALADSLVTGRTELATALFADRASSQLEALVDGLDAALDELRALLEDAEDQE